MTDEAGEHVHWNCPPVRPPRRDELPGGPNDVETYKRYNEEYFAKHGENDDSSPVETYTGDGAEVSEAFVKNHEGPVGQVRWNDEIEHFEGTSADLTAYAGLHECSGTLIDDDLFLTAGHSFVIEGGPRPAHVASQMHVTFGYRDDRDGEPTEGQSYNVVELEELVFRHAGLDYAILRLDGDPSSDYGNADVAWGDAREGDPLCIIGHPNGLPKRVVAGHASHLHDVRIGYDDINTAPGSSGAGILRGDTGRLVGVHSESGIGINKGHNHGTRISAILSVSQNVRDVVEGPYMYESHSAMVDSHSAMVDARRSTVEPDQESTGGSLQKGK